MVNVTKLLSRPFKVMKLLNPSSSLMECDVCGSRHFAQIAPGGHYKRGSWQCVNGCQSPLEVDRLALKRAQAAHRKVTSLLRK